MLTVRLPWPPSGLRPNKARTRHWRANSTAAAGYKALCGIELRAQGVGRTAADRVALTIRFCPPDRRPSDLDGSLSSAKAALDALATALGIDDAMFDPITLCRGEVVKGGAIEIAISEAP